MKKLSVLFLAVCVMIAVSCSNEVTKINNISADNLQAMKTILEDGGTPDSSPEGIADFLNVSDYQGVFATEFGRVGYKIKNSKIYFIEKLDEYNDQWTEITEGIAVDKNLNKLEYQTESGLQILTFDGFGYRFYNQGEERVIYYQKSDYLDGYAGQYGTDSDEVKLVITSDGCITRHVKSPTGKFTFGRYTYGVVLKGDTLTFKGVDSVVVEFYRSTYGYLTGANYNGEYDLKKQ